MTDKGINIGRDLGLPISSSEDDLHDYNAPFDDFR
jgi:hypothetical protein